MCQTAGPQDLAQPKDMDVEGKLTGFVLVMAKQILPMQTGFGLFQLGLPSPPMMQVRVASPSRV